MNYMKHAANVIIPDTCLCMPVFVFLFCFFVIAFYGRVSSLYKQLFGKNHALVTECNLPEYVTKLISLAKKKEKKQMMIMFPDKISRSGSGFDFNKQPTIHINQWCVR